MQRRHAIGGLLVAGVGTFSRRAASDGSRPTRVLPTPRSFELFEDGEYDSRRELLNEVSAAIREPAVGLRRVCGDLNRKAHSKFGSIALYRDSSKRKKSHYPIAFGFTWDRHDSRSSNWYPQGITGSGDASPTGTVGGRRLVLVSWYARRTAHKGVRISVVDITDPERIRYRHLLLVEPRSTPRGASFAPVQVHAGGIVLYRNLLYVVDTDAGVRVFDTDRLLVTQPDPSKTRAGVHGGRAYAFDYRYAIPMVAFYRQRVSQGMRFSFASLDRTTVPHSLWMGEYSGPTMEGFAASFPLNASTACLASRGGRSVSSVALRTNRERTQGFVATHGAYVLNHTYARDPYRLHVQTKDGYRSLQAPYGLEDLYYDPTLDRLWMHTEHPKGRAVFCNTAPDELE